MVADDFEESKYVNGIKINDKSFAGGFLVRFEIWYKIDTVNENLK